MKLFINSVEANAKSIHIEIATNELNNSAVVKIADDGDGIPTNILENIWASFITTKGPNRHGLGLPSTLHIVSQHRGTIAVDSTEGEGTIFTISFPIGRLPDTQIPPVDLKKVCLVSAATYYSKWCANILNANNLNMEISPDFHKLSKKRVYLVNGDQKGLFNLLESRPKRNDGKYYVLSNFLTVEKTTKLLSMGIADVLLKPHSPAALHEFLKNLAII